MAKPLTLIIVFDPATGACQVQGPIDHPMLCAGALEEAKRVIQRRANTRDDARGNGGARDVIIAPADAILPLRP